MTTQTSAPIGSTAQSLEGVAVNTGAGSNLFRESVVVTDPTDPNAYSAVASSQPSSSATPYGIVAWIAGTPNFSSTVNVTTTVNVTANVGGTTQIVSSIPFIVSQSTTPWTINGGVAVTNTPNVNITSSIPFFVAQSSAPWTMNGGVSVTNVPTVNGGVSVTNTPSVVGSFNISSFGGTTVPIGQTTAAFSMPVVQANNVTSSVQIVSSIALVANVTNVPSVSIQGTSYVTIASTQVAIGGGTQYLEPTTTTNPTGTVAMGLNANTTRALRLDASNNLLVNVAAGGTAGTQYLDPTTTTNPTGTVAMGMNANTTKALQLDANNRLQVTAIGSLSVTNSPSIVGAVNISSFGGTTIPIGQTTAAFSMPVVLANNVTSNVTLISSVALVANVTNVPNIGGVNITSFGGTTIPIGQTTAAFSMPVAIASNISSNVILVSSVALVANVTNIPTVNVQGTSWIAGTSYVTLASTQVAIGGGTQYLDGATTTGPTGTVSMGFFNNTTKALRMDASNNLLVNVAAGGTAGTQYLDPTTTTNPTGTIAMGLLNNTTKALKLDASQNLLVNVAAGGTAGTQYLENTVTTVPTGTDGVGFYGNSSKSFRMDLQSRLNVDKEPTTILYYDFSDNGKLDTTAVWSQPSVANGAQQASSQAGLGYAILGSGNSANSLSTLNGQTSFAIPSPSYLSFRTDVQTESTVVVSTYRAWGLGQIDGIDGVPLPFYNGVIFEIQTTGAMIAAVWANSSRTVIQNLGSSAGNSTQPYDGGVHAYFLSVRKDRADWAIDDINNVVATYRFVSTSPTDLARSMVPAFYAGNSTAPTTSGTIKVYSVTVADPAGNGAQMSDSRYPWRKASVDSTGAQTVRITGLGQTTSAFSVPVVLPTDQSPVSTAVVTWGTTAVNVGATTGARSIPVVLPSDITPFSTAVVTWGTTATFVGNTTAARSIPVTIASDQGNVSTAMAFFGTTAIFVGQTTAARSMPVVLASNVTTNALISGTSFARQGDSPWLDTLTATTVGGATATSFSALAATLNTTVIKTGSSTLYGFYASNQGSSWVNVRLYNLSTAALTIASTAVPRYIISVPASTAVNEFMDVGISFSSGITLIAQQEPYTATSPTSPQASTITLTISYQ